MALSYTQSVGDGSNRNFPVAVQYLSKEHVSVAVDGTPVTFTWVNPSMVQTATAPALGAVVEVRRTTPRDTVLVDYSDGSTLTETDLDTATLQSFFLAQESFDLAGGTLGIQNDGAYSALNRRIGSVADPVNDQDVVTKAWALVTTNTNVGGAVAAKDLAVSAKNAAEAARDISVATNSTAQTAATTATDKAAITVTQAGIATTKAGEAATSASTATTKAGEASTSAASAQARWDDFRGRYYGPLASEPTLDPLGNAVEDGDLYFNTTVSAMRLRKGGAWSDATANVNVNRWRVTNATGGMTILTGVDSYGLTLSYKAGLEQVFRNGVLLEPVADYARTSTSTITLVDPCNLGDTVTVLALTEFSAGDFYTKTDSDALLGVQKVSQGVISSSVSAFDVTLPSGFKSFEFRLRGLKPSVDALPFLRISQDNGVTFSSGNNYHWLNIYSSISGANTAVNQWDAADGAQMFTAIRLTGDSHLSNSQSPFLAVMNIDPGAANTFPSLTCNTSYYALASVGGFTAGMGALLNPGRATTLRVFPSVGTILAVEYELYGYK